MSGLLDFIKTPEGQGLLSAVAGGLAGARRGAPLNSIGRAGLAGLAGYSGALDRQGQEAEAAQMRELRGMQVSRFKREMTEAEAAAAEKKRIDDLVAGAFMPVTGTSANAVSGITGPRPEAAAVIGQKPKIDPQALIAQGVPFERTKQLMEAQNLGRNKVARTVKGIGPDGREYEYQVDEFGQRIGDGLAQFRAPLQVNQGDRITFVDPYKASGSLGINQSVDSRASQATAIRGQNMTDARARERLKFDQSGSGHDGIGASQAGLTKLFGKAPAGFRWKDDGSMEFIPGGPADQKAQLQKSGEGTVGSVVADLRDKYTQLNEGGGIVSTQKGILENLAARTSVSSAGQAVAGAVGTKNQSARDSIAMTRPLLLQAIMKATGMSAKQMDSNAELKLYLATATDPTLGLEANMQALERIENLYGGGPTGLKESVGATGSWEPSGKSSAVSSGGWSATLKK
jgi:hypothetical protein